MTTATGGEAVFVEAPARLHFGVLDLRGALGRRFGGIGAAAPSPTLLVSASPAAALEVDGEDAERAADFARRFLSHHGVTRRRTADGSSHAAAACGPRIPARSSRSRSRVR